VFDGLPTFGGGAGQGDLENELVCRFDVVQSQAVDADRRRLARHGVHGVGAQPPQSISRRVAAEHRTGRREFFLHRQTTKLSYRLENRPSASCV